MYIRERRAVGLQSKTTAILLGAGSSTEPVSTSIAGKNFIQYYTRSTATSGDARGIYNRLYIKGAGGSGESLRSATKIDGVAANTAHGAHISLMLGDSSSSVTGLGVGVRGTLEMASAAVPAAGTYAAVEGEIYSDGADSDPSAVTELAVFRAVNGGNSTGQGKVDDKAALFSLSGFSAADGNMVASKSAGACPNVVRSVRVLIDGTPYYIMLCASPLTA